ncbi:hypothetical protein BD410DRAFT_879572 [Rickenella mellea]|uniref:DNA2/NAM7 helicase-like C-terminal domain-containing protein n=1 Tax=Rickenella mellea TaxID=50990 RepID=A0A4Y7QJV0_9AGAM|nr:hypothetical protein BD410DRAFT_879572 [Rickenella mellea]
MENLDQDTLLGPDLPRQLKWRVVTIAQDISEQILSFSKLPIPAFGIAKHINLKGKLEAFAVAGGDEVLVLVVKTGLKRSSANFRALSQMFEGPIPLAGFSMARMAILLSEFLHIPILKGIDLSTLQTNSTWKPWSPAKCVHKTVGGESGSPKITDLWDGLHEGEGIWKAVAMRAWISAIVAKYWQPHLSQSAWIKTTRISSKQLKSIAKMLIEDEFMDANKPRIVGNEFTNVKRSGEHITINNARFKTRVRRSKSTHVVLTDADGMQHVGRARGVNGRTTHVTTRSRVSTDEVKNIYVIGKEESTCAELARDEFLLLVMQGLRRLFSSPFVRYLWSPAECSRRFSGENVTHAHIIDNLNQSQSNVVDAMTATDDPVVVVHGPPGTGKTSTISAATSKLAETRKCSWIVAQSNVGVKNIAENLQKRGVPFKLIVSKEFYVEWHEHIYKSIPERMLIRSDVLEKCDDPAPLLHGIHVILCTLSMLSNPVLEDSRIYQLVPVEQLVVDEASQIGIFNYMHLFHKFRKLQKVCFFGDPKQRNAPYGQDNAKTLQCIFDLKHLQSRSYFLDTQCKPISQTPATIRSFISSAVYDKKLHSVHKIRDPSCLAFVDIYSTEEQVGKSWKNSREVHTVVRLVEKHYHSKNFCIITPYDPQRKAIEVALRKANLPWGNVFNVDSFQG